MSRNDSGKTVDLKFLKKLGKAESRLAEISADTLRARLDPFKDDPEVAKVIDYISRYRAEIPESHPIFKRIEDLKNAGENKKLAKEIVRERADHIKKGTDEREDEYADALKKAEEFNAMLDRFAELSDRVFEFLTDNQKEISILKNGPTYIVRARRLMASIKNGIGQYKMRGD